MIDERTTHAAAIDRHAAKINNYMLD